MPVFFQHRFSGAEIRVWKIEEEADFFQETLPVFPNLPAHPVRRRQSLAARFLLQQQCPDFPFEEWTLTDSGRPYLSSAPLQFSLSHANLFAAVITHPHLPVGIDIEQVTERIHRVRKKYLSEAEERIIGSMADHSSAQALTAFFTLAWSVKEAAFKALHQTGVDFIQDLPLVAIHTLADGWQIELGGRATALEVHAGLIGEVCWAACVEKCPMTDVR